MKLRIDINPYFKKIADHYWDHLDPQTDGTIWEWMAREYQVVRISAIRVGENKTWVSFPSEEYMTLFMLRWA
jgi:hypothetical protein